MLSQTTQYALRAMACLAFQPDTLTPTPQLAKMAEVPPNYLAKVLQMLAQSDLVVGRRGVGGGYRLARPPEEITLHDIVDNVAPFRDETTRPIHTDEQDVDLHVLHDTIEAASKSVVRQLSAVTLADVINGTDTKSSSESAVA